MSVKSFDDLKALSIDDALNLNIDEIPELGIKLWPNGTYAITFKAPELKGEADKKRIVLAFTLDEVGELEDAGAQPPEVGAEHSLGYPLPTGVASLRTDFKEVFAAVGASTPSELLDQLNGYKVIATLGQRPDRTDKTRIYQTVKAIVPQV